MSDWSDSRPASTGRSAGGSGGCLTPPPQGLQPQQPMGGYHGGYQGGHPAAHGSQHGGARGQQPAANSTDTRVLLVVLRKLTAPVELDRIFHVFSQFGRVEKISTFIQHNQNQVVVQFESRDDAHTAMGYLNGRDLYVVAVDGKKAFCSLAIVPSRLQQLTFKREDSRNRDYSHVNMQLQTLLQYVDQGWAQDDVIAAANQMGVPAFDFLWGRWILRDGWLEPQQEDSARGMIPAGRGLPTGKIGECVHLSGLPAHSDKKMTASMLWNCCGMYGELVAVKLLAQHPGCALLQYRTKTEADNAIRNLNYCRLYDSKIFAQVSRNANATHWRGAQTELEMRMCTAEDMAPPAPAPTHITGPPCPTLAAWGLPDVDSAGAIASVTVPYGATTFNNLGQGMATATFNSTEAAFEAVCALNGTMHTFNGAQFKACLHFANDQLFSSSPPIPAGQQQASSEHQNIANPTPTATPLTGSFGITNSSMSTPPHLALSAQVSTNTLGGTPGGQPLKMDPSAQHGPPIARRRGGSNGWSTRVPTVGPHGSSGEHDGGAGGGKGRYTQVHSPYGNPQRTA